MAESERARIMRLAGRLKLLVWVVIGAAALLYAAARFEVMLGQVQVVAQTKGEGPLLWIARDASALLLLAALWQLASMLRQVELGERFSLKVTSRFRRFALLLFLAAAVTLVAPLAGLIAPPASGRVELAFSFRDVWTMLVTGVLFLVARLLDEAQQIETEMSEIV